MTEDTSPSQQYFDRPTVASASAHSSATLPPSSSSPQRVAQSSATLSSSLRPSNKPLTHPGAAQSLTLSSPVSQSAVISALAELTPNTSSLPPTSAFTPTCPTSTRSSHHVPSTPPSSAPTSPRAPQQVPRTSQNQLSVSSSHNSLDGEVQVSDIYFVSSYPIFFLQLREKLNKN